jgi:choline dehydrogenase-like flavoprotein
LIPWALKTGNLTLKSNSVVHSILYDKDQKKAIGVRVIDSNSKTSQDYFAKVVFVSASTLNTNLILLNSKSDRFPDGLGNDNGLLGKFIAFHNYRATINAQFEGFPNYTTEGAKPTSHYVPRFRNIYRQETDFLRGYAAGFGAQPQRKTVRKGFGAELTNQLLNSKETGVWNVNSHMMGETIPKSTNLVSLDPEKKDEWGIPLLNIDVDYDDNDEKMIQDFYEQFTEMYEKAGFVNISTNDNGRKPGNDIHEMGGVRMGKDPQTSLLNKWNQMHGCKNVFVTDGACMTSTSTQNPSLTFMAISARAANYAIQQMKKGLI